ncbi:GNAT family N-acetyltransferase [Lysinibacillus sp. KU-BSD001]|uniref:GNAT family N-acetyltransferase n=1 Tax=Lysinibacillus sp. KU-BSD001 TaxID=3141328 RepID=UPI0036E1DCE5
MALENGQPVGMIMVETENDFIGSVALVVKPSLRKKGYGRLIIEKTMLLPEMSVIKKWFAGIEADNFACIKCFQSIGYKLENTQPDEDGYYSLIHF